jgi:hypothetical protein
MMALVSSWEQARRILAGMKGSSLREEVLAERQEQQ